MADKNEEEEEEVPSKLPFWGKPKRWTDGEKIALRENYATKTIKELMKLIPGRSPSSIRNKAGELNLTKESIWSENEKEILRLKYNKVDIYDLMEILKGRSEMGIRCKAYRMGLTKKTKGRKKQYKVENEDAFKHPNRQAWFWVGFLHCKATINGDSIIMSLSNRPLLEEMQFFFKTTYPIRELRYNCFQIYINSEQLVKDFRKSEESFLKNRLSDKSTIRVWEGIFTGIGNYIDGIMSLDGRKKLVEKFSEFLTKHEIDYDIFKEETYAKLFVSGVYVEELADLLDLDLTQ